MIGEMKKNYIINCTFMGDYALINRDVAMSAPYIVLIRDQCGRCQKVYFGTLEKAEAAAEWFRRGYESVEIFKGHGGKWESVSQS